jgi:fructan beta-fructosidase
MKNYLAGICILLLLGIASCKQDKPNAGTKGTHAQAANPEPHRPQFHFTPPSKWMNDPNGMFYLDGEYHLSYQYYPDSTVWGPMHWGHAVSKDLIRWEHLPVALYPDSLGYIFSGGSVVDINNTSGFGSLENPPVVAAFTHNDPKGEKAGRNDFQTQSIAWSPDKGRTWTKYSGNPVLSNKKGIRDFRDPKLIWHEDSRKWIMALAVYDRVQFYGSLDLKTWEYLSDFGIPGDTRLWECPDLFPLTDPKSGEIRWVLLVSIQQEAPNGGTATSYFIGDFDGQKFLGDPENQKWLDWGTDNYAFVTWDNAPVGENERIGIGWMSNWQYAQEVPTATWRSAMTVPRILELQLVGADYALSAKPIKSLETLRASETKLTTLGITGEQEVSGSFSPSQCEILLRTDLANTTAGLFGITLSNGAGDRLILGFDRDNNQVWVDRRGSGPTGFSDLFFKGPHTAPLRLDAEADPDLRIFLDVASIEVFAEDGLLNFTEIFFPAEPYDTLTLWADEGEWILESGTIYELKNNWETDL